MSLSFYLALNTHTHTFFSSSLDCVSLFRLVLSTSATLTTVSLGFMWFQNPRTPEGYTTMYHIMYTYTVSMLILQTLPIIKLLVIGYTLLYLQLLQAVMQEFSSVAKGDVSDADLTRAKSVTPHSIFSVCNM